MTSSKSSSAAMCNPKEDPTVCAIIEQRNNVLDELARTEGRRRTEAAKYDANVEYWRQYVAGLVDGAKLHEHLQKVCAYQVPPNKSVEDMCHWWDTAYVPHPVAVAKGKP